ncbi:hypothetical protein ACJMK2_042589 [Sinanodonta woodiana]|uniref:VWFA and cache domain-containing protein 1-like n=1 Tax=Sinanodonta woodiana TaxID=1069815 RepID=A0ABD3W7W5_SINWO
MATWRKEQPICDLFSVKLICFLIVFVVQVSSQDTNDLKDWLKNGLNGAGRITIGDVDSNDDLSKLFTQDGYFTDLDIIQDLPNIKALGGINIEHEAQKLSARLRWLSNEEIGVTAMQAIYDSLPYTEKSADHKAHLEQITEQLRQKFRNYQQVLRTNKITVENLYKFHVKQPITKILDCCSLNSSELRKQVMILIYGLFQVAVIGLSSEASYTRQDSCLRSTLVPVTYEAKFYFTQFIKNLKKEDTSTNHSLGFQKAFEMIENTLLRGRTNSMSEAMIIYISRGLLNSLPEAREVMETIATHNSRTGFKVIINTYAVIDDDRPIMYEKRFLQDIADQNFAKYEIQVRSRSPILKGVMLAINNTRDLGLSVGRFYLPLNRTADESPVFSLPYLDAADSALTLSINQPCLHNGSPIGIVGVDLHVEDLAQDITYFTHTDNTYAFLVSTDGYTIMHPSFARPIKTIQQPMHTDIWHFENVQGFAAIRSKILRLEEGEDTLMLQKPANSSNSKEGALFYAKYIWKKVENTPYVLVIKILEEVEMFRNLENIQSGNSELLYHRIDLLPTNSLCLHFKQLATLDTSTIFLSANSFNNPFAYLSQEETKRMVQIYMAYLKDDTLLISNPGFKDNVRNDVAATFRITSDWSRRFRAGHLNDYIVRRYVATPSGVFRMFPGTMLDKTYDPLERPWYKRAMEFPGHVTLTAPYLDVGGAGYIVTISHTVFEGKHAAMHSPNDRVAAVMGMDVTLGYFYKIMVENIPTCGQKTVRCFLMNDKGYIITHPSLVEPNGKGPVEELHITHKEPLVANDILNHRHFVKKKLCNRYNDRTVQRFYLFNTSLNGVLTNLVHGEHCARYQITHIPGSNLFLGITNHTCDTATAFCPCSMLDRLCLNCNRMEQSECECPCECPLAMDFCTGDLLQEEDVNPSCPDHPEQDKPMDIDPVLSSSLGVCYQPSCDTKKTESDCLGVMGCDWCQMNEDGVTLLPRPYCASYLTCFGGVLGATTPYGYKPKALPGHSDPPTSKSTPVGPVAGGIMGCFLVLALGVYCYRHHIHRNSHQYINTLPENHNRISNYYEVEEPDVHDEPGAGHTNFVLATFDNPASVSPYRVNTSYRRPAGGDSDHGYSTMTPHEDSEHASLPCLEPLIIGKDRYKPTVYSMSRTPVLPPPPSTISRRSRSPTPPQTRLSGYQPIPEQTTLPRQTFLNTPIPENSHNILANVQVHMVDTY